MSSGATPLIWLDTRHTGNQWAAILMSGRNLQGTGSIGPFIPVKFDLYSHTMYLPNVAFTYIWYYRNWFRCYAKTVRNFAVCVMARGPFYLKNMAKPASRSGHG